MPNFTYLIMANNTSSNILNTSANLLGFCLIVITSLHVANKTENNYLDELTAVVALLLSISCFFFIHVNTNSKQRFGAKTGNDCRLFIYDFPYRYSSDYPFDYFKSDKLIIL